MFAASTETSGNSLLAFWRETRLRVADARAPGRGASASRRESVPADWLDVLTDLLRAGYALEKRCHQAGGAWEILRRRTTPSAGALYPFELMAVVSAGAARSGNYLYDLEAGELRLHASEPLTPGELGESGFLAPPGSAIEALLVLLGRPWLSMKKYGLRGYAYCHLDAGHTAANLALYAASLGHVPAVHLRFSRSALLRRLELEGLCREPLVALSFSASQASVSRPRPLARGVAEAAPEPPGAREMESWETVAAFTSIHAAMPPPVVPALTRPWAEPRQDGAVLPLPGRPSCLAPAEMKAVIFARRSARGFRSDPLSLEQLGALLASIRTAELCCDAAAEPLEIGLTVVARSVAGLSGVFLYDPRAHSLIEVDRQFSHGRGFARGCMRQVAGRTAAALLLIHAPIRPLVDRWGYSAFAELHFHAADLGQRLYLAAAETGVGITCIGGFDEVECARLGRLAAPREVFYVVACGVADEGGVKHDRLDVAYSHGRTSLPEEVGR